MAEDYGTDCAAMQLAVALFLVTSAAQQALLGLLSDRFGRRPLMLASLIAAALAAPGGLRDADFGWRACFRRARAGVRSVSSPMICTCVVNGLIGSGATSAFLSLRLRLAGTARGVGGALMIGGGAMLLARAGSFPDPVHSAEKRVGLQRVAALAGLLAVGLAIGRERRLTRQDVRDPAGAMVRPLAPAPISSVCRNQSQQIEKGGILLSFGSSGLISVTYCIQFDAVPVAICNRKTRGLAGRA